MSVYRDHKRSAKVQLLGGFRCLKMVSTPQTMNVDRKNGVPMGARVPDISWTHWECLGMMIPNDDFRSFSMWLKHGDHQKSSWSLSICGNSWNSNNIMAPNHYLHSACAKLFFDILDLVPGHYSSLVVPHIWYSCPQMTHFFTSFHPRTFLLLPSSNPHRPWKSPILQYPLVI